MNTIDQSYLTGMQEITAERYNDMLNILPPQRWTKKNGAESFICPEPIMLGIHDYFVMVQGRYFVKPCKTRYVTHEQIVAEALQFAHLT